MELETQAAIAERIGYLNAEVALKIRELSAEVGKLLNGLSSALSRRN